MLQNVVFIINKFFFLSFPFFSTLSFLVVEIFKVQVYVSVSISRGHIATEFFCVACCPFELCLLWCSDPSHPEIPLIIGTRMFLRTKSTPSNVSFAVGFAPKDLRTIPCFVLFSLTRFLSCSIHTGKENRAAERFRGCFLFLLCTNRNDLQAFHGTVPVRRLYN